MTITHYELQLCPTCGAKLNAAAPAPGAEATPAQPGDFCLCMYCGNIFIFDTSLVIRETTPADFAQAEKEDPGYVIYLRHQQKQLRRILWGGDL